VVLDTAKEGFLLLGYLLPGSMRVVIVRIDSGSSLLGPCAVRLDFAVTATYVLHTCCQEQVAQIADTKEIRLSCKL
jgi:hypothetical protein